MAGWNDYANFTSLDKLRLTAPLHGMLPLIKAINERCEVASMKNYVQPLLNISKLDSFLYGGIDIDTITTKIQNKITELIPLFVNHIDNGGVWIGLTEIPNWTEADILTEIGKSRLPVQGHAYELSTDWLYQQKKIIDLLLWLKDSRPVKVDYTTNGARMLLGTWDDPHGTIDAAIATADPSFSNPPGIIGAWTRYNGYNWNDVGEAWNGKGKFFFDDIPSINKDFDLYLYIGLNEAFSGYADYDDGGRGYIQDKLNLLESGSLLENTTFTSVEYGAPDSEFPKYPPVEKLGSIKGWEVYERNLILKFNVPGGFEFVEEFNT